MHMGWIKIKYMKIVFITNAKEGLIKKVMEYFQYIKIWYNLLLKYTNTQYFFFRMTPIGCMAEFLRGTKSPIDEVSVMFQG